MAVLDESTVLTLYESSARGLHRYLARRVGAEVAADLVSEAFLVVWEQRADQPFDTGTGRAWLYGVATNLLRRHVRSEERRLRAWSREHAGRTDVDDIGDRVADLADAASLAGPLAGMLARLRAEERDVLLLSAWADLTPAEIATALALPAVTVRTRLHRARARLRTGLAADPRTSTRGNDDG